MAGLAFGFKLSGSTDYTKSFLVLQALRGWRRGQVEDQRCPVSFQLLENLGSRLDGLCFLEFEVLLFQNFGAG